MTQKQFLIALIIYVLVLIGVMLVLGPSKWDILPWKIGFTEPTIIERNIP